MMAIVWFLLIITVLVVVHEFGHYLAAVSMKTRVEEFAIGFGPALFKLKGRHTQFRFNVFPLGGYVRLAGEDNGNESYDPSDNGLFINKKPWQKLVIALSGPVFSILLGYIVIGFSGMVYGFNEVVIEKVIPGSPADEAGLLSGDIIKKVNFGYAFDRSILSLNIAEGKKVDMQVVSSGKIKELSVVPSYTEQVDTIVLDYFEYEGNLEELSNKELLKINGSDKVDEVFPRLEAGDPIILEFEGGTFLRGKLSSYSAEKERYTIGVYFAVFSNIINVNQGKFQKGDKIIAIDDFEINGGTDFLESITKLSLSSGQFYLQTEANRTTKYFSPFLGNDIFIKILRDGNEVIINIEKSEFMQLLSSVNAIAQGYGKWRPKGAEVIGVSIQWANSLLKAMLQSIGQLFTGKADTNDLMGPVGIANIIGQAAQAGIESILSLIALITLNLGIFNLLPLPALDGGRIVFSLYEMISRRKVNPKVEAIVHFIGFALLMVLMVYVTFNDITRFMK
jgi:regulator of sigma E protease